MQSNSFVIEGLTPNDDETRSSRNKHKYVTRQQNIAVSPSNEEKGIKEPKASGCRSCREKG